MTSDGAVTVATTVSSMSSKNRHTCRSCDARERHRLGDSQSGHVRDDPVRNVGGQRLDVQLARDVLEHAALLDAGRLLDTLELERDGRLDRLVEPHLEQVEVDHVALDRVASAAP